MTDDRTPEDIALDTRARAAASGVRTAVAERPVPAFDPDLVRIDVRARPGSSGRSRPVVGLLAAAAAVLVVVAAVVALAGQGDDDSAPTDRIGVDEVRRYVLGEVPDGFMIASVLDTAEPLSFDPGGDPGVGAVAVYGPDATTPRIGVFVYPDDQSSPDGDGLPSIAEDQPEVEVPGRRAWEADDGLLDDSIVVEVDGTFVVATGAAAEREELVAIAGIVAVEDGEARLPEGQVPDGLSFLGRVHYLDLAAGVAGLRSVDTGDRAWTAAYLQSTDDEIQATIVVSAALGDPIRARAPMLATTDVEAVTVRGHDGLLAHATFPGTSPGALTVTWEERPGEMVQVSVLDTMAEDDLLDLAEGLRTIDAADVPALRREALLASATFPGVALVGRGTFTSGHDWVLLHHAELDTAQLETTAAENGSSSSFSGTGTAVGPDGEEVASDAALLGGVGYGTAPDGAWAYGLLGADVAEVRIRDADGETAPVTIVEGDGVRGWVAELPASEGNDVPSYEVRALDADGRALETLEIGA